MTFTNLDTFFRKCNFLEKFISSFFLNKVIIIIIIIIITIIIININIISY